MFPTRSFLLNTKNQFIKNKTKFSFFYDFETIWSILGELLGEANWLPQEAPDLNQDDFQDGSKNDPEIATIPSPSTSPSKVCCKGLLE